MEAVRRAALTEEALFYNIEIVYFVLLFLVG